MSDIAKALIEARKNIQNPKLDSINPHFKSKFASLKAVLESVTGPCLEQGIYIACNPEPMEGGIQMTLNLIHESGENMSFGPLPFPCTKINPQDYASAVTYARRYILCTVFGIVGEDDDDGNAASRSAFKSKQMKAKYYDGLKAGAAEEDGLKVRELWDELDSEQQIEIWNDLRQSSRVRSTIKRLLEETPNE